MKEMMGISPLITSRKINNSIWKWHEGSKTQISVSGQRHTNPASFVLLWVGLAPGAAHNPWIKTKDFTVLHHFCNIVLLKKDWSNLSICWTRLSTITSFSQFLSTYAISFLESTGLFLRCFCKEHLTESIKNLNLLSCFKIHLWCFSYEF